MADHRVAFVLQTLLTMLQMLVPHLQLLYHNHQQQVDMENYMNYMLLNPPEHNQKGNHGNHAREGFVAAFGVFCGGSTAPLTGPAYVLQRLQRVEQSRVNGHVS